MNIRFLSHLAVLVCALGACSADTGAGATTREISGYTWTGAPVSINGLDLAFGVGFSETEVTAQNTCNDALTVSAAAPVTYSHEISVETAASQTEGEGDNTCTASIDAGTITLTESSGTLTFTQNDEVIAFTRVGSGTGLFGTWSAPLNEIGTLQWSINTSGALTATANCGNELTAVAATTATYKHFFEITESISKMETDGAGLECFVEFAAGKYEYRFVDGELELIQDGEAVRLQRG